MLFVMLPAEGGICYPVSVRTVLSRRSQWLKTVDNLALQRFLGLGFVRMNS